MCNVLAARVAVHFQYIVEKLSPHDTIFSFTTFSELKDTRLSPACSLHTASASIKSSSDSLRPPALSEIAEDAHENQSSTVGDYDTNRARGRSAGSEQARPRTASLRETIDRRDSSKARSTTRTLSPSHSTRTIRNTNKALPPTPPEPSQERKKSIENDDENRQEVRSSVDTRPSFQSSRPSTRDRFDPYEYKPKIKLGPRPSIDLAGRAVNSDSPRPISTLPASVRMPTRKALPVRPKSQQSQRPRHETKPAFSPPLPIVPISIPNMSSEAKMSATINSGRIAPPKSPAITPEKRRLMKALQLRQKQMAAMNPTNGLKIEASKESVHEKDESITGKVADLSHTDDEIPYLARKSTDEDREFEQSSLEGSNQNHPANTESSPISMLDPSDGPSTQASSITEEEDLGVWEMINTKPKTEYTYTDSQSSLQENDPSLDYSIDNAMPKKNHEMLSESPLTIVNIDLNTSAPSTSRPPTPNPVSFDEKPTSPHEVPLPPVDNEEEYNLSCHSRSAGVESELKSMQTAEVRQSLDSNLTDRPQGNEGEYNVTRPSTSDTFGDLSIDKVPRKNGLALSIRASSPENSDDHFLSDDSFMEELRSATVQEAKPVSVSISKSPITPVFPRFPNENRTSEIQISRSVSNPLDEGTKDDHVYISPKAAPFLSTRSYSASHPSNTPSQQASAIVLKKVGVSSGISQRIKALEKLSSRPTSPSSQGGSNSSTTVTSPTFLTLRKASLKTPPTPSDSSPHAITKSRQKMSSFSPSPSPETEKIRHKDRSVNTKVDGKSKKSRPESISVTATIIRDSGNKIPRVPANLSEPGVLDLHQSPLMVEHQSMEMGPPSSPRRPPKSRFNSTRSLSSSSIDRKSEPSQASRRDSFASRRSMTSGRGSEVDLPRSISDTSINGVNGNDVTKDEKKESRKSRLFKRMSGISSASRRSIVHALNSTVKEEPIVEHHETIYEPLPPIADFGDVNIQFPDTLVSLCIADGEKC